MKSLFSLILVFISSLLFGHPFIVTASNDSISNELLIYDIEGNLLQTLPTGGLGDVPLNGGGIAAQGKYLAVVNFNSKMVTIFKKSNGIFSKCQEIQTRSKPISVDLKNRHLYVLGEKTVESFRINTKGVHDRCDGYVNLLVGDGSALQIAAFFDQLIISEKSNMIESVALKNGTIAEQPVPIKLPADSIPQGVIAKGNDAFITLSNEVGLIFNGALTSIVPSVPAPSSLAVWKNFLYSTNPKNYTLTSYKIENKHLTINDQAAATTGSPNDIAINLNYLAILEKIDQTTNITLYSINQNGSLQMKISFPTAPNANGLQIISEYN